MKCPFCSHRDFSESPIAYDYLDKIYKFRECRRCRSLVCHPMPDAEALSAMYAPDYFEEGDPHDVTWVTDFLKTLPAKGTFIDYGCGTGHCGAEVQRLGWRAVGIEYGAETVKLLRSKYSYEIVQAGCAVPRKADVVHLADVTEHLTDLDRQMSEIVAMLKPGGYLLCTAPLEGNPNLWQRAVLASWKRKRRPASGAPYHVTWATTEGYRTLFKRFGFETLKFDFDQICFPAPYKLKECTTPKKAAFYALRRFSQALARRERGNRFFYIGRLKA